MNVKALDKSRADADKPGNQDEFGSQGYGWGGADNGGY